MQFDVPDDDDRVPSDQELDALTYLQMVYRGQVQAEGPRMRAAMACLQRPKLAVVASINDPNQFAERLEAAIRRSGINPRMIEHRPAVEAKPAPEPGDVTGPMTGTDRKMRRL
jgi:hypothetical protein